MSKKAKPKPKAAVVDENLVTRQIVAANYGKACKKSHFQFSNCQASLLSTTSGVSIAYLELLDCGIREDGCKALADVLSQQKAPGLLTLNLNFNAELSDAGVSALVDGLFSNMALKQLHLGYCGVGSSSCIKLAQLISLPSSAIETLSLQGNHAGDDGLLHLSLGLARSHKLVTLNLSDNGIRTNIEALTAFRDALLRSKSLENVDFTFNLIEPEGANILLPALAPENTKLLSFLVDASLPGDLFQLLNRASKAEGKKKGGKKGGKKKKK
ncbi:hypothetical protein BBJ29_001442 [Phytophthora kernoviae]|uniref:Uncharacterized protein n=1 Tax=Phytophthora kernoviae TaxID=325452 RepID=A0A3F2RYF0_9STRA|nr:hypothetical protein BBJ29_001442 [Phytophthora kernoviae]RLN66683.1 hypothetical protein BBP00_00002037 [Phytophthora kernoviae]